MQSGYSAHIAPGEWRWVIVFGVGLVLLAFTPFVLMLVGGIAASDWQFMGVLHNYRDGATYLSKMFLGTQGKLMVQFLHTPEPHNPALIQVLYPLLGQIAGFTNISTIVLFHVARVISGVFMYMALYQLGALIWMRQRARRVFFVVAALGAGFGWIYVLVSGGRVDAPDLSIPEAFPFYSTVVNVHFPLTLACLALLAGVVISTFRPGVNSTPQINNGGLTAALASLALALLYPQALVPFGAALAVFLGIGWLRRRRVDRRELSWLLVIALPAVPLAVYYAAVVAFNPAIAEWNRQNVTAAPPPLALLVGLGLTLLLGLPGIVRALRRFEVDGDRFMLLWLAAMLIMMYLPTNIQRRFAVGMMIAIAYFATRSLEDFWFQRINRRWRYRLALAVVPVMFFTQLFVLFTPVLPVLIGRPADSHGLLLDRGYAAAFRWLGDRTALDDVVLVGPAGGVWLPGWAGARVVYGHPYETLQAETRYRQLVDWYSGRAADCAALLDQYSVAYVIRGPDEAVLGESPCFDDLTPVARFGRVSVYAP